MGDPAAREGARFLAGLNALGRLLAVGSEWGSYASPVGGAAGRGLAREVAEEASETIGKQFARQAARRATRQASDLKLSPEVINSFRGGSFAETTLRKPLVVYRLCGGKAKQLGAWFMLNRPSGRLQATIDYAIRPEWGSTLERLVAVQLPEGTKIFVGPAAPQRGLVGGGVQAFVLQPVRPEWVLFDVEFPLRKSLIRLEEQLGLSALHGLRRSRYGHCGTNQAIFAGYYFLCALSISYRTTF